MNIYQHVYGRVTRGYKGGTAGYQLAALSEELAACNEAVEKLNQLSFFHFRGGSGKEVRYSFFRPGSGYLALGCSRWARDLAGTVGAFAHHFVFHEDEFIAAAFTPIALLETLNGQFYESEGYLPGRVLPAIRTEDLPLPPVSRPREAPRDLILRLLDFLCGEPSPFTPLVVAPEDMAWPILDNLYASLHRPRIAELTFSTLFVEASDFASAFRIVFVPERRYIPAGTSIYRVFEADQLSAQSFPRAPLTEMWREHQDVAPQMIRFFDLSYLEPQNLAAADPLIDSLLAVGESFRRTLEYESVPNSLLFRLLLKDVNRVKQYWQAGMPLPYSAVHSVLLEDFIGRLPVLLQVAAWSRDSQLRDNALLELATLIAGDEVPSSLTKQLDSSELAAFLRQAALLPDSDLQKVGERLQPELRGAILAEVAWRILRTVPTRSVTANQGIVSWLRRQCDLMSGTDFPHATIAFIDWCDSCAQAVFRLQEFNLDPGQYRALVKLAWELCAARLTERELIAAVWHDANSRELLTYFASQFSHYTFKEQSQFLQALVALHLREHDYEILLNAIRTSDGSSIWPTIFASFSNASHQNNKT